MRDDASKSLRSSRSGASRSSQKGWRKTVNTYKVAFFNMLCAMMKAESEELHIIAYLKVLIETLQHLAFSFHGFKWGPIGDQVGKILLYTQIEKQIVELTNTTVQLILIGFSLLLTLILSVDTIYVVLSFFSKDFKAGVWPLRLLRMLVSLLSSILFLPIVSSLQSIYSCPETEELDFFTCYNTFHIALIALCSLAMLIVIPFTALISIAFYAPDPQSKSLEARPLPLQDIFLLLDKAITLILAERVSDHSHSFFAFYLIFTSTTFQWVFLKRLPLLEAIDFVKSNDLEGQLQHNALIKRMKFWTPFDVCVMLRFVWKDPSPENIELADSVYQYALQSFVDDGSGKDKKKISFAEKDACSFLCQQYGLFLMICKGDVTTSQLYFKRAQQLKPNLLIEFVTFEAEKSRKERVIAQERGGGMKMDIVDRVEYRQLMKHATLYHKEIGKQTSNFWKALATGNCNISTIVTIFSKMERAEKDAIRYYRQLMARFNHIPKVLQQYSDFLDLTQLVKEAEYVRTEMREVLEEQEAELNNQNLSGNNIADNDVFSERGGAGGGGARALSFAQYAQKRRGTMSAQNFAGVNGLPKLIRSPQEKKALVAYGRIVASVQDMKRRGLSMMIGIFVALLFCILTAEMAGTEYLSVNQVHQSGNMSLWAIQIPFLMRQIQIDALKGSMMKYQTLMPEVTFLLDNWEKTRESLYFDNNLIDTEYSRENSTLYLFMGLDTMAPFIPIQTSVLDAARLIHFDAIGVIEGGASFYTDTTPFPVKVGNITAVTTMPSAYLNRHLRAIVDNVPPLVFGYDGVTDKLTGANETEINITLIIFGSLFLAWGLTLLIMAFFSFYPAVRWIRKQRELVMNVFLKIPQEVCVEMYIKYRFERSHDVDEEQTDTMSDNMSDDGENSDSDEETEETKLVMYGAATSRFKQIIVAYTWVLLYLFALFAVNVAGSAIWLRFTMADAGRRLQRSAQLPFYAQGFSYLTTEILVKDPISPINSSVITGTLMSETIAFQNQRFSLMYGNTTLGLPPRKLSASEQDFFFDERFYNNTKSLDTLSNLLIDDVSRLMTLKVKSWTDASYLRILELSPIIVKAFTDLANIIKSDFMTYQSYLSLWSTKIMYPITVFFLLFAYFKLFQKILSMVSDESQKTVRLLLLIPLNWVGKISDIRKVLDLDATELDIPEIKALTGNADEERLNTIIDRYLNPPPPERTRSASEPIAVANPNPFEDPAPPPEAASSNRTSSTSKTSSTSSSSTATSSSGSSSGHKSSRNNIAAKPKFGSLRQLNDAGRLSKVHPEGAPTLLRGVRLSIAQDGDAAGISARPSLIPSPILRQKSIENNNNLGVASPKMVRGNSVSFGNVLDAVKAADALKKSAQHVSGDGGSSSSSTPASSNATSQTSLTSASSASKSNRSSAARSSLIGKKKKSKVSPE
ncbi:hypothetical protein HDU97_000792 [Phlyctochytrium planicorne]|nr:hypothetical protein HDU97_000792 [Phlyctochytrium planicorne]